MAWPQREGAAATGSIRLTLPPRTVGSELGEPGSDWNVFDEVEYAVAVTAIAFIAMVDRRRSLVSAFNGVASMTIRFVLRFAFILYSHNYVLCPPSEQMGGS